MDERSRDVRQSAEYAAKTVEDALQKAAQDLGVPVSELEYQVLKDSSHTILGLVRTGEAVIRVWRPTPRQAEIPPAAVEPPLLEEEFEEEEALEEEEEFGLGEEEEEEEKPASTMQGNPPELEAIASDVLSTLVDKMGLIAAVEVADRGGKFDPESNEVSPLTLNLVGDDLGALIGRRGETLRDLQFITRLIVSRKIGTWPNLVIDVENYKGNRAEALQSLAKRMADQVRRTGRPIRMEPMPAYERRIVHLALRDDPDVYTESTGEGDQRKVQVLPK
ncbi:MAG: hypothetical protein GX552_02780 [Chloroflexi bacterium]|jgi:spoIIIJ-associated protein|nr:hypothetical protein [Chloroflexota bacterium]